ncbi:hypothetical protein LWI29_026735 [Acer saccharum]|uniref:Uncharacterized protein n=1 Tax=Acer saccharum TaxID=4024 RepID=A0AA39S9Q0_ACESA|nr:hypothetical protein LWI29_026735 [Acer saccharum]
MEVVADAQRRRRREAGFVEGLVEAATEELEGVVGKAVEVVADVQRQRRWRWRREAGFGGGLVEAAAEELEGVVVVRAEETGRHEVPTDEYRVWVYLPWSVESDSHLLEVFRSFSEHKETKIMFEIEKISYITVPPTASSSDIPNPQPRFMTDLNDVDVNGFEENIFYSDGDNDDVGDNDHVGANGLGD